MNSNIENTTNILANRVPADEQAVEQIGVLAPLAVRPSTLDMAVPEDEQAVNDEEYVDVLSAAREKGVFSPAFGMANIKDVLDDRLYALIRIDEKGNYFFDFCEKFENGKFSNRMTIAQSDLFMLQSYNTEKKDPVTVQMRKKATNFLIKLTQEYLMTFSGDREPLNLKDTLEVLVMVRPNLPIQDNRLQILPAEEFYNQVVACIDGMLRDFKHKTYYALDGEELEYLAHQMKMKRADLLSKLKEYNLLYLTESSKGYQTNVRFNIEPEHRELLEEFNPDCIGKSSYTQWSYCIYKKEFLGNQLEG